MNHCSHISDLLDLYQDTSRPTFHPQPPLGNSILANYNHLLSNCNKNVTFKNNCSIDISMYDFCNVNVLKPLFDVNHGVHRKNDYIVQYSNLHHLETFFEDKDGDGVLEPKLIKMKNIKLLFLHIH